MSNRFKRSSIRRKVKPEWVRTWARQSFDCPWPGEWGVDIYPPDYEGRVAVRTWTAWVKTDGGRKQNVGYGVKACRHHLGPRCKRCSPEIARKAFIRVRAWHLQVPGWERAGLKIAVGPPGSPSAGFNPDELADLKGPADWELTWVDDKTGEELGLLAAGRAVSGVAAFAELKDATAALLGLRVSGFAFKATGAEATGVGTDADVDVTAGVYILEVDSEQ